MTAPLLALSTGGTQSPGWSGGALLEFNDLGDTGHPRVAVSADGTALAVWSQFAPDYNQTLVWGSHFEPNSGWSTPVVITRDRSAFATAPEVAVDDFGNGMAVWTQPGGGSPDVWQAPYRAGAGWGLALQVDATDTDAVVDPHVALNNAGMAIVTWSQFDSGTSTYHVWARIMWPSSFGMARAIESSPGSCSASQADLGPAGNAIVVYSCDVMGNFDSHAVVYDAIPNDWMMPVALTATSGYSIGMPRVSMDASDNATVVWAEEDSAGSYGSRVYQYQFVRGYIDEVSGVGFPGGWSNSGAIENAMGRAVEPDVALDGAGGAVAVWTMAGSPSTVWLSERGPMGTWSSPTSIGSHPSIDSDRPRVAMNPLGYGVVAFNQGGSLQAGIREHYFGWNCCLAVESRIAPTLNQFDVGTDGAGSSIVIYEVTDVAYRNLHVSRYAMQDQEAPSLVITDPPGYSTETDRPFITISGTSDPFASIDAGGYTASAGVTGAFSVVVPLAAGNNVIAVRASDGNGNAVETQLEVQFNDPLPALEMNVTAAQAQVDALSMQLADTAAQLQQAQAAVMEAQANLAVVEGTATATQADLSAAQSDLLDAQAALALLESQQTTLQSMLDDAQANFDIQAQALAAAQAQVAALTASLASTSAALNATNASLASANGRIDALEGGGGPSQSDVDAALGAAGNAMLVGVLGMVIGGAGVVTAVLAGRRGGGGGGSGGSGGTQRAAQQAQAAARPAGDKGGGSAGGGQGPAEHGGP